MTVRGVDPLDPTVGKRSVERLQRASESIDRVVSVLPERMRAMIDAMNGQPAGRGFDSVGGRASVTFCELHEKDRCECGGGTTYATPTDPTGDAALPADPAKLDHDRVVALVRDIERSTRGLDAMAEQLTRMVERWASGREATPMERQATLVKGERSTAAFECWSCARAQDNHGNPWFQPAARRVTLADGEARLLCEWCRAWLRDVGELPAIRTVDERRRGHRIRRPDKSA